MRYMFPETKFVKENAPINQIVHILSEIEELKDTKLDTDHEKEEAVDLYHSLETLFRIWEKQGVDMEAVRLKVFEKNRARGYYQIDGDK